MHDAALGFGKDAIRCTMCGVALTVHERSVGATCRSIRCLALAGQAWREAAAIAARARDEAAGQDFFASPREHAPAATAIVPLLEVPLVPADPERVAAFRSTLSEAAEAAVAFLGDTLAAGSEGGRIDPPPGRTDLGLACAACGGHCCKHGGTHAFLSKEHLAEALAREPSLSAADLVAAYTARLPAFSYEGSCVFHGEVGCALDRAERSHVCTEYHCEKLRGVVALLDSGAASVGVAAVAEARVGRAVVLPNGGVETTAARP